MPSISNKSSESSATAQSGLPRQFYPQLDGLRAIAVFLVLMHHMLDLNLPAPMTYAFSAGWIGVDVFFVLSGFLITKILLTYSPAARSFGVFVLRRTLRTWPLYFATLLVIYVITRGTATGTQINWLQHVFFLQNYSREFVAQSLTPLWSLCIEEHFYLVWPFLIFLVPRRILLCAIPGLLCLLPFLRMWGLHHGFTYKQLYTESQFHMDGLMAGSFVALLISCYKFSPTVMRRVAFCLILLGGTASIAGFWRGWSVINGRNIEFGFTTLAVSFAGLLLFLLFGETSILAKAFSLGPIRYIGRISYGIYILQDGLISLLEKLARHHLFGRLADSWLFAIPLRTAVVLCVAAISFRFFESPILRMKDRLKVPGKRAAVMSR